MSVIRSTETPWWWAKPGMWPIHFGLLTDNDYRVLLSVIIDTRAREKSNKATVDRLLTVDDEASAAAFKAISMIANKAAGEDGDELVYRVALYSPRSLIPELVTILNRYGLEHWREVDKRSGNS
jgi:hypothetical protein